AGRIVRLNSRRGRASSPSGGPLDQVAGTGRLVAQRRRTQPATAKPVAPIARVVVGSGTGLKVSTRLLPCTLIEYPASSAHGLAENPLMPPEKVAIVQVDVPDGSRSYSAPAVPSGFSVVAWMVNLLAAESPVRSSDPLPSSLLTVLALSPL